MKNKQGRAFALIGLAVMLLISFTGCPQSTDTTPATSGTVEETSISGGGTGGGSGGTGSGSTGGSGSGGTTVPVTYTVTFDAGNGTFTGGSSTKTDTVKSGNLLTRPTDPAKKSFIFTGWYTAKNSTGKKWNFTKDTVTKNITLYAAWEQFLSVPYNELEEWLKNTASSTEINYITVTGVPTNALQGLYISGWTESGALGKKINASGKKVFLTVQLENNAELTALPDYAFYEVDNLVGIQLPANLTDIGEDAFYHCDGLTNIDLSGCTSLTDIGEDAFKYCKGLTSINLSGCTGLTAIDSGAFDDCSGLTSIDLSACTNLTTIGREAFGGCKDLTSIMVAESNSTYSSENGVLFNKDKTKLIRYPAGKQETRYTVPKSLTTIDWGAFDDCSGLKSIDLSGCTGLTAIGEDAFSGSTKAVVKLPNKTGIKIEEKAFGIEKNGAGKCLWVKEVHCHSDLKQKVIDSGYGDYWIYTY